MMFSNTWTRSPAAECPAVDYRNIRYLCTVAKRDIIYTCFLVLHEEIFDISVRFN